MDTRRIALASFLFNGFQCYHKSQCRWVQFEGLPLRSSMFPARIPIPRKRTRRWRLSLTTLVRLWVLMRLLRKQREEVCTGSYMQGVRFLRSIILDESFTISPESTMLDRLSGIHGWGGFLYSGGTFTATTGPGGIALNPRDINNNGQIVGSFLMGTAGHGLSKPEVHSFPLLFLVR